MSTGRQRILAALRNDPLPGYPVWLMRQAGRFLPEYREIRAKTSFMELVRTPELCTEVALQPLRRFDLDATIVFSDILVIPDAIGAELSFVSGDGPQIGRPLRAAGDEDQYDWQDCTGKLGYVYEAVKQLRQAAPDHAVFGFAGAPWTLFCYLVEGGGSRDFARARTMLWSQPALAADTLNRLTDAVIAHLRAQAEAGADVLQIFDTWGGLLPAEEYGRFLLPGLRRIAAALAGTPTVLFVRGGEHLLPLLSGLSFTAFSLDATANIPNAYSLLRRCTQGNLDNVRLLGPHTAIREGVQSIHTALSGRRNHIFNLGHGILPQTPPEAVGAFVAAIRELS